MIHYFDASRLTAVMYRESGDKELLFILGGMLFL